MANRAAFEIDLPVDELKSFIETYKSFRQQLKEQPEEWAAVGDSISDLIEPIDKIVNAVSGIETAQAETIQNSAAMVELVQRRQQMTEQQTNLIILQRQDLEERIARRRMDQERKDAGAAQNRVTTWDAFTQSATKTSRLFRQIDHSTSRMFMGLKDSTVELLKWGGILTGFSTLMGGLVGAGGLFGIADLASNVMNRSRSAAGMGVSYGENQAFGVDYQNLLDSPQGVLGSIANAQLDPSKWRYLQTLGVSPGDIRGKDAGQLAPDVIKAIHDLFARTGGNWMAMQAYGVDQLGFSEQDVRRIGDATPQQLQTMQQQYRKDIPMMNLPPQVQQEWTDLSKMLARTKTALETDLVNAITPLAPVLAQLSGDLIAVVADLLQEPEVKQGLAQFDAWLKQFGAFLKTDEFQKDLKGWERDFGAGMKNFIDTLKQLHVIDAGKDKEGWHWSGIPLLSKGVPNDPKNPGAVPWWANPQFLNTPGMSGPDDFYHSFQDPLQGIFGPVSGYEKTAYAVSPGAPMIVPTTYEPFSGGASVWGGGSGAPSFLGTPDQFSGLESSYGLPAGLLGRVRQVESGGNDQAVSAAGAEGPFQFMPGTAQEYGVKNPFDVSQAAPAAARMFRDLMQQFHGDLREAVAAYNWGAGNVQNDVSQYGGDWESHLPDETQTYLQRVLTGAGRSPATARHPAQVKIEVNNRTGGSAIITTRTIAV